MKSSPAILASLAFGVVFWLPFVSIGQDTKPAGETLEQRILRGDDYAFIEAADADRKDLVPLIEKFSDDNTARKALAKLGGKKYLDGIVAELTNNALDAPGPNGAPPTTVVKHERRWAQMEAFKKLAYIKDRSTVKVLASYLYAKENPDDYVDHGGKDIVVFETPSEAAMRILPQIVDNPPAVNLQGTNDTHEARVKIWQQWWEENKAKYS